MKQKILLLILTILPLTGCYNYRELTDLAIVSGISISMSNNQYEITIEVLNPKKQQDTTNSEEPEFIIYKQKDSSIQESLRKIIKESPKKLYLNHLNILIIDETVAKNNLKDILDFFIRCPEIRTTFYVLISKNKDILPITTPLENISSQNILDTLKTNNHYLSYTNLVTFQDLINTYLNPYQDLAIPSIESIGNKEEGDTTDNLKKTERNTKIILSGIAIFKNNKLTGYIEENDALTYNLITNNAKTFLIKTNINNQEYIINEIFKYKTKITPNIKKNKLTITITGESSLKEENIKNNIPIKQIQKELNKTLKDIVTNSISKIRNKYQTDIYGIQDIIYKENPKYKHINNINIEIITNITITEKGNINGGIYYE